MFKVFSLLPLVIPGVAIEPIPGVLGETAVFDVVGLTGSRMSSDGSKLGPRRGGFWLGEELALLLVPESIGVGNGGMSDLSKGNCEGGLLSPDY